MADWLNVIIVTLMADNESTSSAAPLYSSLHGVT